MAFFLTACNMVDWVSESYRENRHLVWNTRKYTIYRTISEISYPQDNSAAGKFRLCIKEFPKKYTKHEILQRYLAAFQPLIHGL